MKKVRDDFTEYVTQSMMYEMRKALYGSDQIEGKWDLETRDLAYLLENFNRSELRKITRAINRFCR